LMATALSSIHTYIHTYMHAYIHEHVHPCVGRVNSNSSEQHTKIHTYIHTHMNTYMHVWAGLIATALSSSQTLRGSVGRTVATGCGPQTAPIAPSARREKPVSVTLWLTSFVYQNKPCMV
jgi:hypothetical protein